MLKKYFTPILFLILSTVFFIGCSTESEAVNSQIKMSQGDAEVKVLSGELISLAVNSISIRTENGMEYCFAIDDNTERNKDNLKLGDIIEISYTTDLSSMAKSIEVFES